MNDEALIGALEEAGLSDGEIEDMLSPMDRYDGHAAAAEAPPGTAGEEVHDAVRKVLTAARDSRRPPGKQKAAKPGEAAAPGAKAIRVDTEESYKPLRAAMASGAGGPSARGDYAQPTADDLAELADREMLGFGELSERLGFGALSAELGYTARQNELPSAFLGVGGIGPRGDQACILCGRAGAGSAVCAACRGKHAQLLQTVLGFGERGSAADIYGAAPMPGTAASLEMLGYTARQMELLGYTARQMELLGYTARQMELVGYTARQLELIGEVAALEEPTPGQDEGAVPLTFAEPGTTRHVHAWKAGPTIYSSVRLTGWDRKPRILTAATPYEKAMGIVIGLAGRAGVAPAAAIGIADPLARALGASALIPRIAAASPAVLKIAKKKAAPFITAAWPAG
jgi:hypothetical protein